MRCITTTQAATILGCSKRWVEVLCQHRKLVCSRDIWGRWMIVPDSVRRYAKGRK